MARTTGNAGKVISVENGEGVLFAWFEARVAVADAEANDTWDTPEGRAAESVMGHLAMALEAMGIDLNAAEPMFQSFVESFND